MPRYLLLATLFVLAGCDRGFLRDAPTPREITNPSGCPQIPQPDLVTAEATDASSIEVSWQLTGEVQGFVLQRNVNGAGFVTYAEDVVSSARTFTDTNVTRDARYGYRVIAFSGDCQSDPSLPTELYSWPNAPTLTSVTVSSTNVATVSFTDDNTQPVTFRVERTTVGASEITVVASALAATTSSAEDATLSRDTEYAFTVVTVGPTGEATSTAVTRWALPAAPTGVSAAPINAESLEITWTDAATSEAGYTLRNNAAPIVDCSTSLAVSLPADTTSFTRACLAQGTSYPTLQVCAVSPDGDLACAASITARTSLPPTVTFDGNVTFDEACLITFSGDYTVHDGATLVSNDAGLDSVPNDITCDNAADETSDTDGLSITLQSSLSRTCSYTASWEIEDSLGGESEATVDFTVAREKYVFASAPAVPTLPMWPGKQPLITAPSDVCAGFDSGSPVRMELGDNFGLAAIFSEEFFDSRLLSWGDNTHFQRARAESSIASSHRLIMGSLSNPLSLSGLAAGGAHACTIGENAPYCWGANDEGQLGCGTTGPNPTTTPVQTPYKVRNAVMPNCMEIAWDTLLARAVIAGDAHTCVLLDDETMRCWGRNDANQTGNGVLSATSALTGVCSIGTWNGTGCDAGLALTGVHAMAAGTDTTCAVAEGADDALLAYCWGKNDRYQAGSYVQNDATMWSPAMPVCTGDPGCTSIDDARAVSVGDKHGCVLRQSGKVFCWGDNQQGQLGFGEPALTSSHKAQPVCVGSICAPYNNPTNALTNIVTLAAGLSHTCALKNDGSVWCWGDNTRGQLGPRTPTNNGTAQAVCASGTWDGTQCTGATLSNAIAVAAGGHTTCAAVYDDVADKAHITCWGAGDVGQLGEAGTADRALPGSACAVDTASCATEPLETSFTYVPVFSLE